MSAMRPIFCRSCAASQAAQSSSSSSAMLFGAFAASQLQQLGPFSQQLPSVQPAAPDEQLPAGPMDM